MALLDYAEFIMEVVAFVSKAIRHFEFFLCNQLMTMIWETHSAIAVTDIRVLRYGF